MVAVFEQSSFLILPQKRGGFGLSVLEAMAAGRAVIHSAIPGADEIMENGVNGILVAPDDEKQLAQAINSLVKNPKLLSNLGQNARERARDFTWSRHAQELTKLYGKIRL
jgi:glycosyltransferase involved in cell wall biosynthesis